MLVSHVRRDMDVGGWLRGLGLDKYEGKFRDGNIDLDVLPQLTADDLKDIGVSAVGNQRRLLAPSLLWKAQRLRRMFPFPSFRTT
jgi:hypothetical protein